MADAKMCALIRQTWYEAAVRNLSDAERLAFYEVCFAFEFSGIEPNRKSCPYSSVLLMFDMVKQDLSRDAEKAARITERNRANGSLGGRPVRPRVDNEIKPEETNPTKPNETQENPPLSSGLPLHNTTQQNTTINAAESAVQVLNGSFFDAQVWPKLDPTGRYRSRHRACVAMWLEMPEQRRRAISTAVLAMEEPMQSNPYFYLADFGDPEPVWLSGRDMESIWSAGGVCVQVKVGDKYKVTTKEDATKFGLEVYRELHPQS